jgi:Protein of unknown function (DUF1592)/Protein of unknown function (DUF1588)/Protein of unknown function (DUF1595)/Protein of unknown function (DUF1585)/Protein of unknown function (DUF1587)
VTSHWAYARGALMLAVSVTACGGRGAGAPGGTAGAGGAPPPDHDAVADVTTDDSARDAQSDAPVDAGIDDATADAMPEPGVVALHRLDSVEYDNTAKDLLGVTTTPASHFLDDETDSSTGGFDNLAENLHMSPARYQQDFEAAKSLADAVWSDDTLRARIVTCAPDAADACAHRIVAAFGLRAWRRPLTDGEVAALVAAADGVMTATGDFQLAMKRVVTIMLSSVSFLYKVEAAPAPGATTPGALSGYELASRLSYLLWSSMPDDALLALGDGLRADDVLSAQLDRMLEDPRAAAFVENFAGQWLGMRELAAHGVTVSAYPEWDATLQQSLTKEMSLYFEDFLDRTFDGFLTADLHFVDARLALHYRVNATPAGDDFERVELLPATHTGFLGLAGFLTLTSTSDRTSPAERGRWILDHLLCDAPPPHPGAVPSLDAAGVPVDTRAALEKTFGDASCAACHDGFDGVGFALEHFDGIGQFRADYSPTLAIDATGTLDGAAFDGAAALAATLAKDPRVPTCAARKALSYALGRVLVASDAAPVAKIVASWQQGSIRALLRTIVLSDSFRLRREETP